MVLKGRYKLLFNGVDLMQWIDGITAIERNIGQNRSATLMKVGRQRGETFSYLTNSAGTITVSALVVDPVNRRSLADAISTDVPMQLIFGDEPDKYYTAIADQQAAAAEAYHNNVVTLYFTVPDNVAHAVTARTFTGAAGAPINVTYNGTAPSYPILTQTITGDNGLVGWVNSNGALLQFGDPESVDGEELTKSDRAIRWDMRSQPADAQINTNCVTPYKLNVNSKEPNQFTGTVEFGYNANKKETGGENTHQSYGTGAKVWHGPGMHGDVAPNSNDEATGDFLFRSRFEFTPDAKGYGRMEFTMESGGTSIATGVLRDSTYTNTAKVFEWWVNGHSANSVTLDKKKFKGNFLEMQITRQVDVLTFKVSDIKNLSGDTVSTTYGTYSTSMTVDGFDEVPIDGVTVCAWAYDTGKAATMYWTDLKFDWVNVEYWHDIPNQFEEGDEVVADVGARKLYVNGVESGLYTIGNQWKEFAITEDCIIEPVVSSWATPGTAKVEVREAYL
ncbi:distal tail protein Dit [Lacticaseibacillus nasuensis]|uniref:distal tail protein Dit n=1 Tax=Lacticaseibacillus nasuensis TaxID=944671 RepID=UPI00224777AC|nr:distal tail protein Dit [Lacticaseibacillus nasuensis]MCX2455619.1 phage tail family protein [Lacticaseibacillus nasuensis]